MALKDSILVYNKNGFLNFKIEGNSKIVIKGFNKRINVPLALLGY